MTEKKGWKRKDLGAGLDLVNISLSWTFIDRCEERIHLVIFGKPSGHLAKFFSKAIDSLVIHVRLRNKLGHGDCTGMSEG
jgi:hypothetical protein